MDELDLLKKDWKRQEDSLPKLSYEDIYPMILKKSSSIVRWIFLISLFEFLLLFSLEVVGRINGSIKKDWEELGLGQNFNILLSVFSFGILIYFILRFYNNYRSIKTTDSAKVLMKNILKTRKTVKYYVFINLTLLGVLLMFVFGYTIFNSPELVEIQIETGKTVPKWILALIYFAITVIMVAVVGGIYYLLYGLLVKRLKANYRELQKLEV